MKDRNTSGSTSPEPTFAPGEEIELYLRQRAGEPIAEAYKQHFASRTPNQREQLEELAKLHLADAERVREEIAEHPEGYAWHKTVGGGLPSDWTDAELTHLRPRDWKHARAIMFVRTSRHSVPNQSLSRARPREHRPVARRTSSSSSTSSTDPGESDLSDDPEPQTTGHVCGCCVQPRPVRFCACGCGREITHRRRDAKTFGAPCRQALSRAAARERFEPTTAKSCECLSGFFFRDSDGDAVCGLCGCWLAAKVAPRVEKFDELAALMSSNGMYVSVRAITPEWRVTDRKRHKVCVGATS